TYATKGGTPAGLGYSNNYLVDNSSCVIVGVQATAARMSQETVAAQGMITRFAHWQGREAESVTADTTYGNGEFLQWLAERNITPYMRTRDSVHRKNSPFYGPDRFTYQPESNSYLCPAGEQLNYGGRSLRNRTKVYIGTRKRCVGCALKAHCTSLSRSCHPHGGTSSAACPRVSEHAGVCQGTAAEKEGGSPVRGTQESDRTPPPAITQIEVRAGAVLFSGGCTESQTPGPVPQPTYKTCSSYRLETEGEKLGRVRSQLKKCFAGPAFSTPTSDFTNYTVPTCNGYPLNLRSPMQRANWRSIPG